MKESGGGVKDVPVDVKEAGIRWEGRSGSCRIRKRRERISMRTRCNK